MALQNTNSVLALFIPYIHARVLATAGNEVLVDATKGRVADEVGLDSSLVAVNQAAVLDVPQMKTLFCQADETESGVLVQRE